MVISTVTERGVLSANNCITLAGGTNCTAFNAAGGTVVGATAATVELAAGGTFAGKVIEIVYGTGSNQARMIESMSGATATLSSAWGTIPDGTSVYVVHMHSGQFPTQTQRSLKEYMKLASGASAVDDFYVGAHIKILEGPGKNQILEISEYTAATKVAEVSPKIREYITNESLYAIYGESGLAASATATTLVLDGNQSAAVAPLQYVELIAGTGRGQVRMISALSGNTANVAAWVTTPDATTRYAIFGGWAAASFESVLRHSIITVASDLNIHEGQRAVLEMISSMDTSGDATVQNSTELSITMPNTAHAISVVSQFFRLKIIGMGTELDGAVQTIFNSYKSGKITTKMEDPIHEFSDCELNRTVITGKTFNSEYKNIKADSDGNLHMSIKNPVDGFGAVVMVQPRQYAELIFLNNRVNPALADAAVRDGGTVAAQDNICSASSGTAAGGKAVLYSRRRMRYHPGLAICVRFSAMFSTPIADSVQLIGYGDCCDGLFVGYNGLDFGILFRRGGLEEIRKLTITAASTADDTITITLAGTATTVAVLATDSKQQIAKKIAEHTYSGEWNTSAAGATVLFLSQFAGGRGGTYSYAATGDSAGTFSSVQAGAACTDLWTEQSNWNRDRGLGYGDLPVLNFQKGNVFEIGVQWLGFGNIVFRAEHPEVGTFYDLHMLKYANRNAITSLRNPNLPVCVMAEKTGANTTDAVAVRTASIGMFIMGDNNKTIGPRMSVTSIYSTASGALTGGTYYNVLALRNVLMMNGARNHNECFATSVSACLNTGSAVSTGGVFTFFAQAALDISTDLTWIVRNPYTSTVEYSTDAVELLAGDEIWSIALTPNQHITLPITELEMYVPPGVTVVCAFKPFETIAASPASATATVVLSANWVQR